MSFALESYDARKLERICVTRRLYFTSRQLCTEMHCTCADRFGFAFFVQIQCGVFVECCIKLLFANAKSKRQKIDKSRFCSGQSHSAALVVSLLRPVS